MKPPQTPAQAKTKDAYLRKNYHISLEDYNSLRALQGFCCAICQKDEGNFKNGMAVDHDHKTGEVRGLLCWICNKIIGRFRDDHDLLRSAAQYVTKPPVEILKGKKVFTAPGRVGSKVRAKLLAKLNGTPTPKRRKTSGKASGKARAKRKRAKKA
jgi:Recombination endonuclease VII